MIKIILIATSDFAIPTLERLMPHNITPALYSSGGTQYSPHINVSIDSSPIYVKNDSPKIYGGGWGETHLSPTPISFKHKLVLVISKPEKPKGRNNQIEKSNIHNISEKNNIPYYQPDDINTKESIEYIRSFNPDLLITVSYGAILNKELRTLCPLGAINLHPSLLPLHRGADPVRSTLLAGDEYCGNTVFFISSKMDSGQIIYQNKYKIKELPFYQNYTNMMYFLSEKGADNVIYAISEILSKKLYFKELKNSFKNQNHEIATYSTKLDKDKLLIDFKLPSNLFIRYLNSYSIEPGYYCFFRDKKLKLLEAEIINTNKNKETGIIKEKIKNKGLIISLSDADILIKTVQYENKKIMEAWRFEIGMRINIGERLVGK